MPLSPRDSALPCLVCSSHFGKSLPHVSVARWTPCKWVKGHPAPHLVGWQAGNGPLRGRVTAAPRAEWGLFGKKRNGHLSAPRERKAPGLVCMGPVQQGAGDSSVLRSQRLRGA